MQATESRSLPPHPPLDRYYGGAERQRFLRDLFDEAATDYDAINAILSFGSGNRYRREALERAGLKPGEKLLDVATGTGGVARAAARITGQRNVCGVDASMGMLLAGRRVQRLAAIEALGERLPIRNASFDMLSIGFALRHLPDLRAAFEEWRRVLKPDGRILILEITPPSSRAAFAMLRLYMKNLVPLLTRLVTRRPASETMMRYHWDTITACVPPETILGALAAAGFHSPARRVEMGIFSEYTAKA
jgi:demethylmenaquinone methyltransferase/2-methoxy-6-polyprenyl-1,4-benzoquinol methylase